MSRSISGIFSITIDELEAESADFETINLTTPLAVSSGGTGVDDISNFVVGKAQNIKGGATGYILKQTGLDSTGFIVPGTSGQVLKSTGSNVTFGNVNVSTEVTGILPETNGGTGLNSLTNFVATKASNIAGGAAQQIVYQTGADTTGFIPVGTNGQVLTSNGLSVGFTDLSIGSVSNITGGTAGAILQQTAPNTTGFISIGTAGQVLTSNGTTASFQTPSSGGIQGGTANSLVYQTAPDTTGFVPAGTSKQYLKFGTSPTWATFQFPVMKEYLSSGSYVPGPNVLYILVCIQGAGGGGGGAKDVPAMCGGGGGGGAYTEFFKPAGTYSFTVGNGGSGGTCSSTPTNGSGGGSTTFDGSTAAGGSGGKSGNLPDGGNGGNVTVIANRIRYNSGAPGGCGNVNFAGGGGNGGGGGRGGKMILSTDSGSYAGTFGGGGAGGIPGDALAHAGGTGFVRVIEFLG